MDGLANLESLEGTCTTSATLTFTRRPRILTITNDSSLQNLQFRFSSDHDWATLKPTETVSMHMSPKKILLAGASVPYRIWSQG